MLNRSQHHYHGHQSPQCRTIFHCVEDSITFNQHGPSGTLNEDEEEYND
jgi:hypothetical protein